MGILLVGVLWAILSRCGVFVGVRLSTLLDGDGSYTLLFAARS